MSGTNDNLELYISADASGVKTGMKEAENAVKSSSQSMETSTEKLAAETRQAVQQMRSAFEQMATGVTTSLKAASTESTVASKSIQDALGGATDRVKNSAGGMGGALAMIRQNFMGLSAAMAGLYVVKTAATFEQLEIRLNSLMGSAEKGKGAFDWIKQFSKDTPFEVDQVGNSFARLKAFGLDPMDGTMQAVADTAAKMGRGFETMDRISLALGQAWTKTKLQGGEILQLIEAGVPVWDMLAKVTGKTAAELFKMSEKGEIGRDVMKRLIQEMGKNSMGASAAQMQSFNGKLSTFSDNLRSTIADIMKNSGAIKGLGNVIEWAGNHLRTIGVIITTVVAVALTRMAASTNIAVIAQLRLIATSAVMATSFGGIGMGATTAINGLIALARQAFIASRALLAAAFSNPFTAIIAGIGLAVAALMELKDVTIEVAGEQTTLGQAASDVWTGIVETVDEATTQVFQDIVMGAINGIMEWMGFPSVTWAQVWSVIKSTTASMAAAVYDLTIGMGQNIIGGFEWLASRASAIIASIVAGARAAVDAVVSVANSVANLDFSGAYSKISSFGDNVSGAMKNAYNPQAPKEFTRASTQAANALGALYQRGKDTRQGQEAANNKHQSNRMGGGGGAPARAGAGGGGGGKGKKGGGGGKGGGAEKKEDPVMAQLREQLEEYRDNKEARLAIQEQLAERMKKLYGAESKEYARAQKDIAKTKKDISEQQEKIAEESSKLQMEYALDAIDKEQEASELRAELGTQSALKTIQLEQEFERKRLKIKRDALMEELKLEKQKPDRNPVQIAKINADIEKLEIKHNANMRKVQQKALKERMKEFKQLGGSIEASLTTAFESVINGTATMGQALRTLMGSVASSVVGMLAQIAAKWIVTKATEMILGKASAMSSIGANAGVAGSAAYASTAAIPIVGPAMAPAAAAASYAGAMSFMGYVASAQGGFDIPAGVNPLTQLHEKEMVLPAQHADTIRQLGQQGGGEVQAPTPAGPTFQMTYNDHSGSLTPENIRKNAAVFMDMIKRQQRNFKGAK